MNPFRLTTAIAAALFACATIPVFAQVAIEPDAGKPGVVKPAAKPVAKKPVKKAAKNAAKKATAKKPATQRTPSPPAAPGATIELRQGSTYSTGPTTLRDKQGNVIPTNPEAYPVGSARPGK